MTRPDCVVNIWDLAGEPRPRFTSGTNVKSVVRNPSDAVGLTQMGVHLRCVEPGQVGTNRHFHTVEEEWTYVLSGVGAVRIGPHRLPVRAGTFVGFPPGPRPHHFIAAGSATLVLLEGGERRPGEDVGCYVDIPRWWSAGGFLDRAEAPPPEEGDAAQCVHIDDLPIEAFQHDVDAGAHRRMRRLQRPTGLVRQAVAWAQIAAARSTAFHTHTRTDEWILILDGRALVRVGAARFAVGPGDFIGHPAGGGAHCMEVDAELTYLVGGQIDAQDVTIYPDAGVRREGGVLRGG